MAQDGAYRRLMDHYYETAEPLPANTEQLLRICRAFDEAEKGAVLFVLQEYFVEGDDGWHHLTIDAEIIKRIELSEKRANSGREGGKTSGESRANGKAKPPAKPQASDQPNGKQLLPQEQSQLHLSSLRSDSPASPATQPQKRAASRHSLPENFPTSVDQDWARDHWLTKGRADLCSGMAEEVAKFRDHHTGNATMSADWPGSWRTWARNAMNFIKKPSENSYGNQKRVGGAANSRLLSANQSFGAGLLRSISEDYDGGRVAGRGDEALDITPTGPEARDRDQAA